MQVSSPAFEAGALMPKTFAADGRNFSPPLEWTDIPEGAKGYALICEDPDAPRGTFTHWLLYNLPPDMTAVPQAFSRSERISDSIKEGRNDSGTVGWFGPKPPSGSQHNYVFRVFALNEKTNLPEGLKREELLREIGPRVIAERQFSARFRSR